MFLLGLGAVRLPEAEGAIFRSGDDRFAVGRKADAIGMAPMSLDDGALDGPGHGQVPEADGPVGAGGRQGAGFFG